MSLSRDEPSESKPKFKPEPNADPKAQPERKAEPAKPAKPTSAVAPGKPEVDSGALARDLDEVQRGKPERAFNVGAILGIALTAAAAIFMFQNRQSVEFDWLWFTFSMPVWAALLGGAAAGVVLMLTILAVHARRQGRIGRRSEAAGRLRRAIGRPRQVPKQA